MKPKAYECVHAGLALRSVLWISCVGVKKRNVFVCGIYKVQPVGCNAKAKKNPLQFECFSGIILCGRGVCVCVCGGGMYAWMSLSDWYTFRYSCVCLTTRIHLHQRLCFIPKLPEFMIPLCLSLYHISITCTVFISLTHTHAPTHTHTHIHTRARKHTPNQASL